MLDSIDMLSQTGYVAMTIVVILSQTDSIIMPYVLPYCSERKSWDIIGAKIKARKGMFLSEKRLKHH